MSVLLSTAALPEIAEDVRIGLTSSPKWLSSRLFYDATGSALFEQITRVPEYYLTRTERQILTSNAKAIALHAGTNLTLVELGAGTAEKTRILIASLLRRQLRLDYYPVDVCRDALQVATQSLTAQFPSLRVRPMVADYCCGLNELDRVPGRKLVLYLGSSIGNFEPPAAAALLCNVRASLRPGDALLLGADMVKPTTVLLPAYNDAQGVTARFNKNLLVRTNRELGADFDPKKFRHLVRWNSSSSRIEMHLRSLCEQRVSIAALGLQVRFAPGETIHTENSYKYTAAMLRSILRQGGFALERTWMDERRWFSLCLARVP
ncbi:MAG: L-histidine N(alpha)-methyltransferase [Terriglobales bacterium]